MEKKCRKQGRLETSRRGLHPAVNRQRLMMMMMTMMTNYLCLPMSAADASDSSTTCVMGRGKITQIAEGGVLWTVDAFSSLEVGEWYWSPNFSFAGEDWYLWIRRESPENGRSSFILLQLSRMGGVPPTLYVEYTFGVQDRNGDRHGLERNRKEFGDGDDSPWIPIWLQDERMPEWAPDDTLTVFCHLERIRPTQDAGEDCDSGSSSLLQKNKVLRDLKDLLNKKEECDVVLKVQGQEFPAHRNILMARSPVLASTFRSDMKEKATGVIEIEDCDPSSFADFLCYLYCGAVENLSSENVFNLFTTADKYDVQDLRSECLEFVKENLSVDTFCDTITLALRHSETDLLLLATDFFTQNAPQIIVTAKWQQFSADNPTQSNELFVKLLVTNKNSNS